MSLPPLEKVPYVGRSAFVAPRSVKDDAPIRVKREEKHIPIKTEAKFDGKDVKRERKEEKNGVKQEDKHTNNVKQERKSDGKEEKIEDEDDDAEPLFMPEDEYKIYADELRTAGFRDNIELKNYQMASVKWFRVNWLCFCCLLESSLCFSEHRRDEPRSSSFETVQHRWRPSC